MEPNELFELINNSNIDQIRQELQKLEHDRDSVKKLVNSKDEKGYSALSKAVHRVEKLDKSGREARLAIIKCLLEYGADPYVIDNGFNFLQNNIYACAYKTVDSRKSHQYFKTTPQAYADAADFHEEVVRELVNRKNKLIRDKNLNTLPEDSPERKAQKSIDDSLKTLVKPGDGDLSGKLYSCLNLAIWSGRESLVKLIIAEKAALETIPNNTISCVHEALLLLFNDETNESLVEIRLNILRELINAFCDDNPANLSNILNARCNDDYKTLVEKNQVTTWLASFRGDPVAKFYNAKGDTPLHSAIRYGCTSSKISIAVIDLLLIRGAKLDVKNSDNMTPEELATELKKQPAQALLRDFPLKQLEHQTLKQRLALLNELDQLKTSAQELQRWSTDDDNGNLDSHQERIQKIISMLENPLFQSMQTTGQQSLTDVSPPAVSAQTSSTSSSSAATDDTNPNKQSTSGQTVFYSGGSMYAGVQLGAKSAKRAKSTTEPVETTRASSGYTSSIFESISKLLSIGSTASNNTSSTSSSNSNLDNAPRPARTT